MTREAIVTVSFDPKRSRLLGMRWMARVGVQGDFGSGRTRRRAIESALRIYERDRKQTGRFDEQITLDAAHREVAR